MNYYGDSKSLRRSIFSMAGSFGKVKKSIGWRVRDTAKFRAWSVSTQRLMRSLLSANPADSLHRIARDQRGLGCLLGFCLEFARATKFLTKNAPKFSQKCLSLKGFILWVRKNPAKLPAKFPSQKSKKFTSELLQERREKRTK